MAEPFKGGQSPTLFPMMKAGSEDAATSIFFSVFDFVYEYRNQLLKSINKSAYKNGNDYSCVLRPSIGGRLTEKDIPDAKIILDQKEYWQALIEVKIGAESLDQAQLGRYLNRAIEQKVDALITISNEMCVSPISPPLRLKPADKQLRKKQHFHWSWRFIIQQAQHCIQNEEISEQDTKLLKQFIEFLKNDNSKIHGYHQMPNCWSKFVETLRAGGTPSTDDVDDVIAGWFQESADLAMILTDHLGVDVVQNITETSAELRKEKAEELLQKQGDMKTQFILPNKNSINVELDIDGKCFRFETSHKPTSKYKTSLKQIEFFLKQFVSADEWGDHSDVRLFARWSRIKNMTDMSMSDALINLHENTLKQTDFVDLDRSLMELVVRYSPTGSASAIKSRKKSIEFLEDQLVYFAETYVDSEL